MGLQPPLTPTPPASLSLSLPCALRNLDWFLPVPFLQAESDALGAAVVALPVLPEKVSRMAL